jgi:L-glyceraldehyde 3-phosphate reductase
MSWQPASDRYSKMKYNRTGRSGLKLPAVSLGLWHNFGGDTPGDRKIDMCRTAFDLGITHFDLANNYGPPPGSAETAFGEILRTEFSGLRDELIISSKAGYDMWPGPYGDLGSRKYLIASCDQSLRRMGLDYVDIFYSHRYDPNTPLEETMGALAQLHRNGKALYVGISNYPREQTKEAYRLLKEMGVPLLIHQPSYSILNRWIEDDQTLETCGELGVGVIAFSPLAQGLLTGKYNKMAKTELGGTRASENYSLSAKSLEPRVLTAVENLGKIAKARKQTMTQLALAWVLRRPETTSALIGVRTLEQLKDCLGALDNLSFTDKELSAIDAAVAGGMLDGRPATTMPD